MDFPWHFYGIPVGFLRESSRVFICFSWIPMTFLWGEPTGVLLDSCGISLGFPWDFHDISLGFLWHFFETTMRLKQVFYGISMEIYGIVHGISDWDFYGIPIGCPWCFYDMSMGLLWNPWWGFPRYSIGFLWYDYGIKARFLCHSHDVSMIFLAGVWRNSIGFSRDFFVVLMLFLRLSLQSFYDIFWKFLLGFHDISMGLLWDFNWK